MKPLISVCIANYNGEHILERCLSAALAQACPVPFEIIVHDDASTDRSVELLKSYAGKIVLLQSDQNSGYCTSNNKMFEQASGKYLLLLNNDAFLRDGALDCLYKRALREEGSPILTLPQYNADTGDLIDRGSQVDIFVNPIPDTRPGDKKVPIAIGACLWIEADLLNRIGGLPEWFGSLAEDTYLCFYAKILAENCTLLDSSGFDHKVGHSFGGGKTVANRLHSTYSRRRLSERNKTWLMFLFYPPFPLLLLMPLHVVLLLLEGAALSLLKVSYRPLWHIYLPTILSLFKNLPFLWGKRAVIQGERKINTISFFSNIRMTHGKIAMLFRYGIPGLN